MCHLIVASKSKQDVRVFIVMFIGTQNKLVFLQTAPIQAPGEQRPVPL
jgi:hypothetical protein